MMQKDVTISRRIVTVLLKMILLKIILLKIKKTARCPDRPVLIWKNSLLYKMPLALRHAAKAVAVKPRKIMVANM